MKKFLFSLGALSCFLFLPLFTFAQTADSGTTNPNTFNGVIPAPSGSGSSLGQRIKDGTVHLSDVPLVVIYLIDIATKVAGTIAVIFILYAGLQFIMSGMAETKEAAKTTLKWAIIGLIITFLSWVVVNLIMVQLTSGE